MFHILTWKTDLWFVFFNISSEERRQRHCYHLQRLKSQVASCRRNTIRDRLWAAWQQCSLATQRFPPNMQKCWLTLTVSRVWATFWAIWIWNGTFHRSESNWLSCSVTVDFKVHVSKVQHPWQIPWAWGGQTFWWHVLLDQHQHLSETSVVWMFSWVFSARVNNTSPLFSMKLQLFINRKQSVGPLTFCWSRFGNYWRAQCGSQITCVTIWAKGFH